MKQNSIVDIKARGAEFCENVIQNISDTPKNEEVVKMVTDISKMFSDIYKKRSTIACDVKTPKCGEKGE